MPIRYCRRRVPGVARTDAPLPLTDSFGFARGPTPGILRLVSSLESPALRADRLDRSSFSCAIASLLRQDSSARILFSGNVDLVAVRRVVGASRAGASRAGVAPSRSPG